MRRDLRASTERWTNRGNPLTDKVEFDLPWNRLDPAHPPVVLLGGVSLVRSLGMVGIPVIVASSNRREPAFASRYCVGRCDLPPFYPPAAATAALIALGEALMRRFGARIPLMYGDDDALELLQGGRDDLQPYFLFLMSDPDVTGALIAKDRFQAFGKMRGLPLPRSLTWDGDGPDSLRGARGEILTKPKDKLDWHQSELFHSLFGGTGKARVFSSSAEILGNPLVERYRQQLCFQEYITGTDRDSWSFHGFADERGELLASFVGRKVRTYPVDTGESAFIELAHDEKLNALGREIIRRCPLRGVFKMDFKRDARDGRWYLLEINARFNLWHYLGAVNGVNLPAVAYQYLVAGERALPSAYETRFRWLSWRLDVGAYRQLCNRNELTLLAWMLSILRSRNVYSTFSWNDPGPWFSSLMGRLRRGPRRLLKTSRRWLSSAY